MFSKHNRNTITLRNAGEFEHFSKSNLLTYHVSKPEDMKKIRGPVIGYYGALADWLDTSIIERLAIDYPLSSIVLIGLVNNQTLLDLSQKYSNIHLLGEKPYSDLPRYLASFDVCLIPFRITPLIMATNPVKIYEYFASGKPVVSTNIPELLPFKKLIYMAKNSKDFSKMVGISLQESSSKITRERISVAKSNTWEMRAKTLFTEIEKFFPKVSVVILTFNHADLSKISIDSTLDRSKYPNFEVIVVDNNSDTKTINMLKKYQKEKSIKLILNSKNYGFAKGNNIGMRAATGDYIILLNNDVRVTPGWIERLVFRAKDKKVGLVGPVTNSIGNESKIDIAYDPDKPKEIENQASEYTYSHWGQTLKLRNIAAFAWIMSRNTHNKIGELDERFGMGLLEDDDYCMRVNQKNLNILCVDDAFVHHYGGASTTWGSKEFQLLFDTNKAKFEKKWNTKWIPHKNRNK